MALLIKGRKYPIIKFMGLDQKPNWHSFTNPRGKMIHLHRVGKSIFITFILPTPCFYSLSELLWYPSWCRVNQMSPESNCSHWTIPAWADSEARGEGNCSTLCRWGLPEVANFCCCLEPWSLPRVWATLCNLHSLQVCWVLWMAVSLPAWIKKGQEYTSLSGLPPYLTGKEGTQMVPYFFLLPPDFMLYISRCSFMSLAIPPVSCMSPNGS